MIYKKYFFIIIFLFFASCGQRADLIIKPLPIPLPPSEIKISQRGDNLILKLKYPEKFKNGDPYNKLDKIEIQGYYQYVNDKDNNINFSSLYSKENIVFDNNNETIVKFKLPDKTGKIIFYIVSNYKKYYKKSELQQVDFIKPLKPPFLKKPEISEEGIILSWKSDTGFPYYAIYKNDFKKNYKIIDGLNDSFIDSNIEYNNKVKYSVTGISKQSPPLIETALSNIREIIPKDIFPPPKVTNIKYLYLQKNKILINWDKVSAKDLKGYNLYYRLGKNKFRKYNKEPIPENTITINSPKRKIISIYICSIDVAGNESEKSEIIELK